jgi:maltooligosyltrehalose trehalohydrolase
VLRWEELSSEPHASLLEWYRRLIALRREVVGTSETRFADVACSVEDGGDTFVMTHRGITVRADLAGDTVTVSRRDDAASDLDLAFP